MPHPHFENSVVAITGAGKGLPSNGGTVSAPEAARGAGAASRPWISCICWRSCSTCCCSASFCRSSSSIRWSSCAMAGTASAMLAMAVKATSAVLRGGAVFEHRSFAAAAGSVVLRVFTGPEILMRNAWRAMVVDKQSRTWFWLAMGIAGFWSLMIGTLGISLVLAV